MSGINKVILIGHLGNDPVVRYTQDGKAVANISVATSESYKDKDGNKKETTEWHKIVLFNRLGEIAGEYLKKGSKVYIEGKLRTRKWDKDGVTHHTTEILAESMQMLDGMNKPENSNRRTAQEEPYDKMKASPAQDEFDDDIPF